MFEACRLLAMTVLFVGAAIILPVPANAIDFTGAWASQGDLCKLVFTKKGKTVAFAELSDLYGSGLIIEGNRVRGKVARCTVTSKKQDGDNLELKADCATRIMHHENVDFLFKTVDDNSFARILPNIENMQVKYTRCSF